MINQICMQMTNDSLWLRFSHHFDILLCSVWTFQMIFPNDFRWNLADFFFSPLLIVSYYISDVEFNDQTVQKKNHTHYLAMNSNFSFEMVFTWKWHRFHESHRIDSFHLKFLRRKTKNTYWRCSWDILFVRRVSLIDIM